MPDHCLFFRIAFGFAWLPIALLLAACAGNFSSPPASSTSAERAQADIRSRYYVVKRGDTLSGIGAQTGHHYLALAAWNRIKPPFTIYPGQIIRLFPSDTAVAEQHPTARKKPAWKKSTSAAPGSMRRATRPATDDELKKNLKVSWQWPLNGVVVRTYSQTGQKGIDISGVPGQPVRAAAGGKVVYSGQGLAAYGNLIIVKHNEKFLSAYANNRRLLVREGDRVRKGQTIAEVGSVAGRQPSLHFEIRRHGKSVNPIAYLPEL